MALPYEKPSALLLGLSEDLAGEISLSLLQLCSAVRYTEATDTISDSSAEVIFCKADCLLVTQLRTLHPRTPIVVVSRQAEVTDWLDSIEAGATDYCAAPFETTQVKWVLDSSMRSTRPAA